MSASAGAKKKGSPQAARLQSRQNSMKWPQLHGMPPKFDRYNKPPWTNCEPECGSLYSWFYWEILGMSPT